MKKILSGCLLFLAVVSFNSSVISSALAAKPVQVEVLYMNHGPLMDTLSKMRDIFSGFGDKIHVAWYDFESRQGEEFMAKKGITRHVPLMIWIEGDTKVSLSEREISFAGFPTGAGPMFFQGKWTLDDLKTAVDQATAARLR
jgi:hypothetical protein